MANWRETFEKYMAAAAFAEAGEHETAREMAASRDRGRPRDRDWRRPRAADNRPRPEMRAPSHDE